MSKCIYIFSREALHESIGVELNEICKKLSPDNIIPNDPRIYVDSRLAYGIFNPTSSILEKDKSVLLGKLYDYDNQWDIPGREFPDGSFAIFRSDGDNFEIVSDPVASRSIWYYMDEKQIISATSQRAIIMYLGSFVFNEKIIPWMLSTGSLGPDFSWDKRIKRVPPDSSIMLDRHKWSAVVKSNPVVFKSGNLTDAQYKDLLYESLRSTFTTLKLDYSKWALPLSGGYDSRGILCLLRETDPDLSGLKTLTWGLKSSRDIKGNDAFVARELALKFNVANLYYSNDLSAEPLDTIINRFLEAGEGRIDNFADYLDGFKTWKNIFEDGNEGIIRGDEGFGCHRYWSEITVSLNQSLNLCSDISNLKNYRNYGFANQEVPRHLRRLKGETLSAWRDRIFHEHTIPTVFAALTDLKLSYVEQINPFLSRKILNQVRQQPDRLRTEKFLFKEIVNSLSPAIDYATGVSSAPLSVIFREEKIADLLRNELSSESAKKIIPDSFLEYVKKGIRSDNPEIISGPDSLSLRALIKKAIPLPVKNLLQKRILPEIDPNVLAFRVLLICRMHKMLSSCN